MQNVRPSVFSRFAMLCLFSGALRAQVAQDHPMLCGSYSPIALPESVTAEVDRSNGVATLTLKTTNGIERIRLPGVQREIQQVCPLQGGRLVIFGAHDGYTVHIVDTASGRVLDSFSSYSPSMSPNGRWLAMRAFYPTHTEFPVSEQYMLYDLAGTAQSNRYGIGPYTSEMPGKTVYPASPNYAPFSVIDISEAARHEFKSQSFHWSLDSRYFTFADRVGKTTSLILVATDGQNPETFIHSLARAEICAGELAVIQGEQIHSSADSNVTVVANVVGSEGGCGSRTLTVTLNDFKRAEIEQHVTPKRRPAVKNPEAGKPSSKP